MNNKYYNIGRTVVMLFGVLLTLWCILIYMAYWFDRINNIIDISLLPKLTFGKLSISDNESECSFSFRTGIAGNHTVNHIAVIKIVLLGMLLGASLVSGLFFSVIYKFVRGVFTVLGVG